MYASELATIQGLIAQVDLQLPKSWAAMQGNTTGINTVFHMQGLQQDILKEYIVFGLHKKK